MISQSLRPLNTTPARKGRLRWLALLLMLCYAFFPVYWLTNNLAFLTSERFAAGLADLLIVSSGVAVLTLLIEGVAAVGVRQPRFRGQGLLRYTVLTLVALPPLALIAGLYLFFPNPCPVGEPCRPFAPYSSMWPLILAYLLAVPLTVWLLAASFRDLPRKLKESAADSASRWQTFYRLILPLAAPGLVTTSLIAFITGWNGFLWSVGFTSNDKYRTAPIAMSLFGSIGFSVVMAVAAALIISAPLVLLTLAFQRQSSADLPGVVGPANAHRWRQWLDRYHLAWLALSNSARVLLLVLALAAFVFGAEGYRVLTFPYALDYGEAPLLDQTQRLAHGQNIYHADLQVPPYTIANYPPLYMLVQVPLAWLFGPAFWYGRLLSWLAMIGAALFVGLILRTLTGDRLAALVGGLTLLALPYTRYWAPLYRIDSLALCLSLAALWVVVRTFPFAEDAPHAEPDLLGNQSGNRSRNRPWRPSWAMVGVALLLVAAVYTRQSYGLAAPLAAFVWLWSNGRRPQALALAGLVAALGLSLFVLLNVVTGGGFYFNIVTANINEVKGALLQQYLGELLTYMLVPVLIAVLFVLLVATAKGRPRAWRLLLPYMVGAALSGLTIGKVGSNINYLLEFCAAMSFAVGAMLAWQRHAPVRRRLLMLGLALQLFLLLPGLSYQLFSQFRLDSRSDMALIAERIRSSDGPVLADEDLGQMVLAGRPLLFQPFELTQLARAGKWDQTPLLAAIARQEYALILIFKFPGLSLDRDRWSEEMLAAIDQHYTAVEEIGYTIVYRPR